ncbi:unnamed protein product [Chondrus crispus]|uniref:Asparaginase n=1 Tax=Chondrus crispus TaxID=2769 RepID=R7Q8N6_CHOCR|nr:unnamed protein product [Chondrus crispus]CDF33840.1 unnamed protein product [Chondrus crispus]|eukprot:XP_005713659.1 unnamed protein product [Chondrus crispus]
MPTQTPIAPSIIVHGGAWAIPASQTVASREGVEAAASLGYDLLNSGASALDAVEAAVRALEDNPVFDAGVGSCLNSAGGVEMDAAIMTDSVEATIRFGAVAALSNACNPISVARAVMERTPHCLLVGEGADAFAKEVGAEGASVEELVTPAAVEEWQRFKRYSAAVNDLFNSGHDTVGAVVRDANGTLACATSTGGITYKRVGRVGDSPIIGAGLFCEDGVGACSTTGHGESILKVGLARTALLFMESRSPGQAAEVALAKMKKRTGGCGGIVLLDNNGEWSADFTTTKMAWAAVGKDGVLKSGIDREHLKL